MIFTIVVEGGERAKTHAPLALKKKKIKKLLSSTSS